MRVIWPLVRKFKIDFNQIIHYQFFVKSPARLALQKSGPAHSEQLFAIFIVAIRK
jgi:hypothetical protein